MGPTVVVGVYCRISKDDAGDMLGVTRQEDDARKLCAARGWEVGEVYVDDDRSAWQRKTVRPAYRRLLDDIADERINGVVIWTLDRLHRQPRELEPFLDLCDQVGLTNLACVAGDVDLATSEGRLMARIMGAMDAKSSEDTSRRIKRKQLELAEAGKPVGRQSYGYQADQMTVNDEQAAVIRGMAEAFLSGEPLAAIARDLNTRAIPTMTGRTWSIVAVRGVLKNPTIAGLRRHQGKVIGEGAWPAIIDRPTWDRLAAAFADPARKKLHPPRRRLLSGMVYCGRCGAVLGYNPGVHSRPWAKLECKRVSGRPAACGRLVVAAERVEDLITEAVLIRLDSPALAKAVAGGEQDAERRDLDDEIAGLEARRGQLAEMWGTGDIDRGEWVTARKAIEARLEPLMRRRDRLSSANILGAYAGQTGVLRTAWPTLSLDRQRTILAAIIDRVTIAPAIKVGRVFDPTRVDVSWRV